MTNAPIFDVNGWCHDASAAPVDEWLDIRMSGWTISSGNFRTMKNGNGSWRGASPPVGQYIVWRQPGPGPVNLVGDAAYFACRARESLFSPDADAHCHRALWSLNKSLDMLPNASGDLKSLAMQALVDFKSRKLDEAKNRWAW